MKLIIFNGFIGLAAILLSQSAKCSADMDFDQFNLTLVQCQKANNITDQELTILLTALKELESFEESDFNTTDTSSLSSSSSEDNDTDDNDDWESWDDFAMKYKCYIHCVFQELEVFGENGKIDLERFKSFDGISDSSLEIIKDCKNIHNDEVNVCQYAFNIMGCIGAGFTEREN